MILLAALASPGRLSSSFAIALENGIPRSGATFPQAPIRFPT